MASQQHEIRDGFLEELILTLSILKWVILASLTGAMIGVGVAVFLKGVQWSVSLGTGVPWRILCIPIGGMITGWLVHRFAPDAEGHGTEAVIKSIHEHDGKTNPMVVPVKLIATVITLGVGGSAGKEGPAAQIGSGIASIISDMLHLSNEDRRKLAVCGISAGFAGVFGLPIAGSIFGIEVLAIGGMFYEYLLPSFLAGMTAFEVVRWLGVGYETYAIGALPLLNEGMLLRLLLLGMILGIVALLFIEAMNSSHRFFNRICKSPVWRPFIGGVVLVLLALIVSKDYLGLSTDILHKATSGVQVIGLAFLWKIIFTSVTLGSGFSGGVITPLFVVGATAGSVMGHWLGFPLSVGAAMGMIGIIAGAANTPIAAAIMGIEMFGPSFGVYAAAVSITSFLMVGHRSVYASQILYARKTASLQVTTNQPVKGVQLTLAPKTVAWVERFKHFFHLHEHHSTTP